jgi:hypothetical protein
MLAIVQVSRPEKARKIRWFASLKRAFSARNDVHYFLGSVLDRISVYVAMMPRSSKKVQARQFWFAACLLQEKG